MFCTLHTLSTVELILEADSNGIILWSNDGCEFLLGYTSYELKNKELSFIIDVSMDMLDDNYFEKYIFENPHLMGINSMSRKRSGGSAAMKRSALVAKRKYRLSSKGSNANGSGGSLSRGSVANSSTSDLGGSAVWRYNDTSSNSLMDSKYNMKSWSRNSSN